MITALNALNCKKSSSDKTLSYTMTGLSSGTTYYWQVLADDGKGGKTPSDVWTFRTD